MPWIPMYLVEADAADLRDWLIQSGEIGFLISDGEHRWRAVEQIGELPDGEIRLWHVPSGPLPLLGKTGKEPPRWISAPWDGWTEERPGANKTVPYFGPGHPGIFQLTIRFLSHKLSGAIGLSSFGWIGNRYRVLGNGASPETERYWKRLRKHVASRGKLIPREGPVDGPHAEIYAFPAALQQIVGGRSRAANPEF